MSAAAMRFDAWDQDALCAAMQARSPAGRVRRAVPAAASAAPLNYQERRGLTKAERAIVSRRRVFVAILAGMNRRAEIAAHSGLALKTVSTVLARLVKDGLVDRKSGRYGFVYLTISEAGCAWILAHPLPEAVQ